MADQQRKPSKTAIQEARARGDKWCRSCEVFQSMADFGTDRSRSDGLRDYCREADKAKGRARYATAAGDAYRPWLRGGPEEQAAREAISVLSCDSPLPEFISRKAAQAASLGYYFDGRPCAKGHLAKKIVATYGCSECHKAIAKAWEAKGPPHPARLAALEAKEPTYLGDPCENRHDGMRITRNGRCVCCARQRTARWKVNHPDYDATGMTRERRRKDPTKHRAEVKRWAINNPEKVKEALKVWKQANIDHWRQYMAIYASNRRTRMVENGGSYTSDDVARMMERQKGRCVACNKKPKKLQVDHIHPVIRGGSSDPSNLQLLCKPCNQSKGAKDAIEWAQSRGLLL